jgi:hypothetical protein
VIVSQIIVEAFRALHAHYPQVDDERRQELLAIRERLKTERPGRH